MNNRYYIHILNHHFDPGPLIFNLAQQITARSAEVQIVVWDDYSNRVHRSAMTHLRSNLQFPFITWKLESENMGRSAMRQKILNHAAIHTGWMVSLDSDMCPDDDFVDHMIGSLENESMVYSGHHYYQADLPADSYRLHWYYGVKREIPARQRNPYLHFSTGIFALHSSLAGQLYFDASLSTYGHEDTLFGLLLLQKNIPVIGSDLKAIHQGLNENHEFVHRQLDAVHNLKTVLSLYPDYKSRLVNGARRLDRIPILKSVISGDRFRSYCRHRLMANPEKILFLDLLKLSEYIKTLGPL